MSKEIATDERIKELKHINNCNAKAKNKAQQEMGMWRNKYLGLLANQKAPA